MFGTHPKKSLEQFILIIEDNRKDMEMIKNSLAQSGVLRNHFFYLSFYYSSNSLFERTSRIFYPNFGFISRRLCWLKGLENILAQFPNKIIIVLGDNAHKHLGMQAIIAGAQDFLLKEDFQIQRLFQTISFAIERKMFFEGSYRKNWLRLDRKTNSFTKIFLIIQKMLFISAI